MAQIHGQLEKALIENTTSDPSGAGLVAGRLWYRTDTKKFKVYDGTAIQEFVDLASAQTLSSKTLASPSVTGAISFAQSATPATPSAGNNKAYFKSDDKLYTLDSGGNEVLVGSGGGSGGAINLITNGDADNTASSILVPYAEGSGTRPVDGTGGVSGITTTLTTSSPLMGTKSFLFSKPSGSAQGEGASISNIAIPLAFRGKSLKVSFDYILAAGTFAAGSSVSEGDVIVYFYDQTNSKLVEPSNIKLFSNSTTISDKYEAMVQFDSNTTQVRMILHVRSTSAIDYDLKIDNIALSPQSVSYGVPMTDWQSYTPTYTGLGSVTTTEAYFRRVGDSIELKGRITVGTPTGSVVSISLPSGHTVSSSKEITTAIYGHFINHSNSTDTFGILATGGATVFNVSRLQGGGINTITGSNIGVGDLLSWSSNAIPIQGLTSSVRMSDSFEGRAITAKTTLSTGTSFATGLVKVNFDTIAFDDMGGFATASKYVVKSSGKYTISGSISIGATASVGEASAVLYINNSNVEYKSSGKTGTSNIAHGLNYSFVRDLKIGDEIEIYLDNQITNPVTVRGDASAPGLTSFSIEKIQGPQQIGASENISTSHSSTAGQSITTSFTTFVAGTKSWDSHGSYNVSTGEWIFASAGEYAFDGLFRQTSTASTLGFSTAFAIHINGSLVKYIGVGRRHTASAVSLEIPVHGKIKVLSGQVVTIRMISDAAGTLDTTAGFNWVEAIRVGNY